MYAMLQAKEKAELAIVLHALTFVEDLSFFFLPPHNCVLSWRCIFQV